MYTIDSDPRHRLLRLVLSGFWTEEEARAFARDQQAAVRQLGPPFGTHLTLADLRSFALQTQEVSEVIRQLVVNAAATSKRIAVIGARGSRGCSSSGSPPATMPGCSIRWRKPRPGCCRERQRHADQRC